MLVDDTEFYFSKNNPVANVDQRDMEALAVDLLATPEVVKGKELMARRYRTIAGADVTAEAWARFETLVDEFAFRYVLEAVNSDPNYPKVLGGMYLPPHEWFGRSVPGSRSGEGDGPDTNYSLIPIDCYAHYELTGQRLDPQLGDASFTVVGDIGVSMAMDSLPGFGLDVDPDGSFTLTIGPEPAAGRRNHLQTEPEARYLFVRDNRSDWRQTPNAYRVRRLDPPLAPPLTNQQIAKRAARFMLYDVATNFLFPRMIGAMEPNTVQGPFNPLDIGGLDSQRSAMGRMRLTADDAFVMTLSGGAPYRSVTLFDYWFRTFDYWDHTSSMNNEQCIPNADGSTTFVVSLTDPGVHNWLDPVGYTEPSFFIRWQGIDWASGTTEMWQRSELIKLADLDAVLPEGTARVSAEQRREQLTERLRTYNLRYEGG